MFCRLRCLADTYTLLAGYGVFPPAEVQSKAAESVAWAVLLDEDSAEAHISLGYIKATQEWDWQGAACEYERAISLDSQFATAHHWYAITCLPPLGHLEDAIHEILLAQALDPVSTTIACDTARLLFYGREFDAALEQCDRTIERAPYDYRAYWILGLIQEQCGAIDEAVAALRRGIQLDPSNCILRGALRYLH